MTGTQRNPTSTFRNSVSFNTSFYRPSNIKPEQKKITMMQQVFLTMGKTKFCKMLFLGSLAQASLLNISTFINMMVMVHDFESVYGSVTTVSGIFLGIVSSLLYLMFVLDSKKQFVLQVIYCGLSVLCLGFSEYFLHSGRIVCFVISTSCVSFFNFPQLIYVNQVIIRADPGINIHVSSGLLYMFKQMSCIILQL